MRITTLFLTALLLLLPALARAAEPKIVLPTLKITTQRFSRHWPTGRKEPIYGQWSWTPRLEFMITGPLEGGSQLVANFFKPDGSAWLTANLPTPELGESAWETIRTPDFPEGKAGTFVGQCPIQIVLKNALTGTKKVLFTGKYEVKKFKSPYEKSPNATEFYVNHDWTLNTAYMGLNLHDEAAQPVFYLWMRGNTSDINNHLAAYLFKDGKQIASSKHKDEQTGAVDMLLDNDMLATTPGMNRDDPSWYRLKIVSMKVRAYLDPARASSANNYGYFTFLATNPGEYELKVAWDGKPIRALKFTVDKSGKIVNNGMNAKLNTLWYAYPVTILPGGDLKTVPAAMGGAFYGNPL